MEDFEKMAQTIVDSYLKNAVPMEKSITKVALDNGLNPDQTKNLVNVSNVMAHITLFDKKADDKIIEFEPADPRSVLRQIYKNTEPEEAQAESPGSGTDRITDLFGDISELGDKVREMAGRPGKDTLDETPVDEAKTDLSPEKKQIMIVRIRKVAEELKSRKLQHAWEYKEELDKLAAEFAKLYGPDHGEFEKDAMSARGSAALPVLADVRRCLRLPGLETSTFTKTARVVDAEKPRMQSLDRLIKLAEKFNNTTAGYQYLQKELKKCPR